MRRLFTLSTLISLLLLLPLAGRADEPFRRHRYDSWKVLSMPEHAIVFAGNSITDMFPWVEAFGNDPRIVNRGNSGGYSRELLENVEGWVRFKPAKVFIKIGTNDLGTGMSPQSIARNVRRTVEVIRRESPRTEVYLQSILPAYDQSYRSPATIEQTNDLLREMAEQDPLTTYIDLYSRMGGILQGNPYSLDRLHLTARAYQIWLETISPYVGIQPVFGREVCQHQDYAGLNGSYGMRASYFSVLPINRRDVLFFGDEMVKNGEWHELLGNPNVKNRGSWWGYGGNIATVSRYVDAAFANGDKGVLRERPAKMLLYTGTEDVTDKARLQEVCKAYKALVQKLKDKAPGTPIGLVSLMPIIQASDNILAFNAWLRQLCEADKDLTYLDIYSELAYPRNGTARTDLFYGNYLYGQGYVKVANVLAAFIGGCHVISDHSAQQLLKDFEKRRAQNRERFERADERNMADRHNDNWTGTQDWHTMRIGANGLYLSYNGDEPFIGLNRTQTRLQDADLWMRVGNDDEGYRLYNKLAGPEKVLAAPTQMTGQEGGSSFPVMVDHSHIPAGYTALWQFVPSTDLGGGTKAWYLQESGLPQNRVNNRGGVLAFWTSGSDSGSSIQWTPVSEVEEIKPEPQYEVFPTRSNADIPYRIPAIATAHDGTLVAAADYRYTRADIGGGRLDLHVRRSQDNGKTWDEIIRPEVMMGDGRTVQGHQEAGFGDPCLVGDRTSSMMLLTSCSGSPGFFGGTRDHHQGWAHWWSWDNGKTWSDPIYQDEQFIYSRFDKSQYGPIRGWFVGSGKICQSRSVKVGKYYRLYCVGSSCRQGSNETANWALYSDDFGKTWEFLGGCDVSPVPGGDEPKAEELPDGSILLSSRAYGGRNFNIFTFTNAGKAEGHWAKHAFSGKDNNGVMALANACNGEVMLVPVTRKADKKPMYLLLQSVPFGSGRTHVGIYYKELERESDYNTPAAIAANWTGSYLCSRLSSAYSTMTWQHNNKLGFLYEEDTHGTNGGGYSIVYKNYTIEQLTGGAYKYRKEKKNSKLYANSSHNRITV